MIQPIDQISTVQREKGGEKKEKKKKKKDSKKAAMVAGAVALLLAAGTDLNFTPIFHPPWFFLCC